MVTGKDYNILRVITVNKSYVLINSICSTLVPFSTQSCLIRRQAVCAAVELIQIPWLTVSDIVVKNQRLILGENAHGINT